MPKRTTDTTALIDMVQLGLFVHMRYRPHGKMTTRIAIVHHFERYQGQVAPVIGGGLAAGSHCWPFQHHRPSGEYCPGCGGWFVTAWPGYDGLRRTSRKTRACCTQSSMLIGRSQAIRKTSHSFDRPRSVAALGYWDHPRIAARRTIPRPAELPITG
jgi:hypothetical protein